MHPVRRVLVGAVVLFVLLQLVPYGWSHPNPPATSPVAWPSADAEGVARRACYDCHSNETRWPPQSFVAPFSWLVKWDVVRGRDELNFSTWQGGDDAHEAREQVEHGDMPPSRYTVLHPDARLSDADRQLLEDALRQLEGGRDGGDGGDDDGSGGPGHG